MTSFSGYDSSTYNLRISALRSSQDLEDIDSRVAMMSLKWMIQDRRFAFGVTGKALSPERFCGQKEPGVLVRISFPHGN